MAGGKKTAIKVGDKVSSCFSYDDWCFYSTPIFRKYAAVEEVNGTVASISGMIATVKWLRKHNGIPTTVDVGEILPTNEYRQQYSSLEKQWRETVKKVKVKMNAAAKLIREANKMAKAAGASNLEQMSEATYALEDAMEGAGWLTSSWNC